MARLPRLSLPDIQKHVIQRGNNRLACFFAEDDYRCYLNCLCDAVGRHGVAVYAYVLMTNRIFDSERFKDQIEAALKWQARLSKRGRPSNKERNQNAMQQETLL